MLKFVIPQPGLATVNLHQTGAATSSNASGVVAKCVDLRKYPDAQSWCPAHRIVDGVDAPEVEVVAARITGAPNPEIPQQDPPESVQALNLQQRVLDAPPTANGAYDLSALQPGLAWYDLYTDTPINDSLREDYADEACCNACLTADFKKKN